MRYALKLQKLDRPLVSLSENHARSETLKAILIKDLSNEFLIETHKRSQIGQTPIESGFQHSRFPSLTIKALSMVKSSSPRSPWTTKLECRCDESIFVHDTSSLQNTEGNHTDSAWRRPTADCVISEPEATITGNIPKSSHCIAPAPSRRRQSNPRCDNEFEERSHVRDTVLLLLVSESIHLSRMRDPLDIADSHSTLREICLVIIASSNLILMCVSIAVHQAANS